MIEGRLTKGDRRSAGRLGRHVPPHAGQGDQQPGFLADLLLIGGAVCSGRRVHSPRARCISIGCCRRWRMACDRVLRPRARAAVPDERHGAGCATARRAVSNQIDERRAAARSSPSPTIAASARDSSKSFRSSGGGRSPPPHRPLSNSNRRRRRPSRSTYTERLLTAKKQGEDAKQEVRLTTETQSREAGRASR